MKTMRLALIGFGNVGQEFAKILLEKREEWQAAYGYDFSVVAVATGRKGNLVNPEGIDLKRALQDIALQERFAAGNPDGAKTSSLEMAGLEFVDVIIETTPLDIQGGQPAISHIREALERGKHVITTNKGPIAFAYKELTSLAKAVDRFFLFEGTVLDGAPVYNLVRETLLGCTITGISGILNGTTNYILTQMEEGESFAKALQTAQKFGWAEADPSMDIEGWDAAVKVTALMNVLMDADMRPQDVNRTGIEAISADTLQAARAKGQTIKLLCEGYEEGGTLVGKVAPALLGQEHPLAHIRGTTSALTLKTDFAGNLTIEIDEPKIRQTAYAVVVDLLTIAKRT